VAVGVMVWLVPTRTEVRWLGMAIVAFVIFAHRSNIGRMLKGTEPRFGAKKEPQATVAAAAVTADAEHPE
jgi:glycerol-3-phosphate acyltransferase PlsY